MTSLCNQLLPELILNYVQMLQTYRKCACIFLKMKIMILTKLRLLHTLKLCEVEALHRYYSHIKICTSSLNRKNSYWKRKDTAIPKFNEILQDVMVVCSTLSDKDVELFIWHSLDILKNCIFFSYFFFKGGRWWFHWWRWRTAIALRHQSYRHILLLVFLFLMK